MFLNGFSFVAICENWPHKALRRHVARVTVQVARFVYFPHGLYVNPILYSELPSQVEVDLVPLCNGLLDHFTPPACAACSPAVLDFVELTAVHVQLRVEHEERKKYVFHV